MLHNFHCWLLQTGLQVSKFTNDMIKLHLVKRTILLLSFSLITCLSPGQEHSDTIVKLPEVVIADSAINRMTPRSVISGELLGKTNVSDVGELLRNEPNISGIRRGGYAVDPVVRGFRYSQLNIFLDEGIHIEGGCPNRMDPVLAHIEPEMIERIEIVRGPYLLQYGPSPTISIRIITNRENPFRTQKPELVSITGYDANRNGFKQHLALSGSGSKLYYRIGAGFKNFGNYTDGNGKEWESEYHKRDLSADIGIRLNNSEVFSIAYKGAFGNDVMFPALAMDEIVDQTHILSAVYTKNSRQNPANQLKISGHRTSVYHEMDNRFRPQYSQIIPPNNGLMQAVAEVNTNTTGIRVLTHWKTGNQIIEAGFDSELYEKDGTRHIKMIMQMEGQEFISTKKFNLWKDAFMLNNGFFAGISSGNQKLSYSVSARTDLNYSNSQDTLVISKDNIVWFEVNPETKLLLSLSASGSWQISEKVSLSMGLARGTRAPDLQERYIKFLATGFDKYDYLGNPKLKPEINYQADLMLDYKSGSSILYLNLFRSDVQNFITGTLLPPSVARPLSMGAPGVKQFNNVNRAVLYGFETGITAKATELLAISLSAGYTYAYFPVIEKIILENSQATGSVELKNDPISEIPPFEAMFKADYALFKGSLKPEITIRAVAGQAQVSEASYEESTPGYVLANISIGYKPCNYATFTIGANNLFDKAYYDHLNRKLAGTSGKLYEPGRTLFINLKIVI